MTATNWRARALCGQPTLDGARVDPEWWNLDTGHADQAVTICGRCPVRTDCLDEALADPPRGMVAGGWQFRTGAKPIRYPDDTQPAPPARRSRGSGTGHTERARLTLAAARRLLDGGNPAIISEQFGLKPDTIRKAARLVLRSTPETLTAIEDGEVSLTEAITRARRTNGLTAGARV